MLGQQKFSDTWTLDYTGILSGRETIAQESGLGESVLVPHSNPFYFNPIGRTDPVTVLYNFGKDVGPQRTSATVYVVQAALDLHRKINGSDDSIFTVSLNEALNIERQSDSGKVNPNTLAQWLASSDPTRAFNAFRDGSFTDSKTLAEIQADRTTPIVP